MEEKKMKELEDKKREKEKLDKIKERIRAAQLKDEEAKKHMQALIDERKRKPPPKAKNSPKKTKEPKIDPNKVKFNVTEVIKNRSNVNSTIIGSTARNRVQSQIEKEKNLNFSNQGSTIRNKKGYLSAIDRSEATMEHTVHSQSPTLDTKLKLPSLRKRLKKLMQPMEAKANFQKYIRKVEIKSYNRRKENTPKKSHKRSEKKNPMLERLAILGNIKIGPSTTNNSKIHDIWKAHDGIVMQSKI